MDVQLVMLFEALVAQRRSRSIRDVNWGDTKDELCARDGQSYMGVHHGVTWQCESPDSRASGVISERTPINTEFLKIKVFNYRYFIEVLLHRSFQESF